jgi:GDP-L-fucose synthase
MAAEAYDHPEPVNIGAGQEITIRDLVETLIKIIGYKGKITWDATKPNGQPRRCLDVDRALEQFGFRARTDLLTGLEATVDWWQHAIMSASTPVAVGLR